MGWCGETVRRLARPAFPAAELIFDRDTPVAGSAHCLRKLITLTTLSRTLPRLRARKGEVVGPGMPTGPAGGDTADFDGWLRMAGRERGHGERLL